MKMSVLLPFDGDVVVAKRVKEISLPSNKKKFMDFLQHGHLDTLHAITV